MSRRVVQDYQKVWIRRFECFALSGVTVGLVLSLCVNSIPARAVDIESGISDFQEEGPGDIVGEPQNQVENGNDEKNVDDLDLENGENAILDKEDQPKTEIIEESSQSSEEGSEIGADEGNAVEATELTIADQVARRTIYVDCNMPKNGQKDKNTGNGTVHNPYGSISTKATRYMETGGGVNGALIDNPNNIEQILFAKGGTCTGTLYPQLSGEKNKPLVIGAYDPATGAKLENVAENDRPVLNGLNNPDISLATGVYGSVIVIEDQSNITVENLTITAPLVQNDSGKLPAYNPSDWNAEEVKYGGDIVYDQHVAGIKVIAKTSSVSSVTIQNVALKDINCTTNACSGGIAEAYSLEDNGDGVTKTSMAHAAISIVDLRTMSAVNKAGAEPVSNIVIRNNTFDNIASYGVRTWTRWNTKELLQTQVNEKTQQTEYKYREITERYLETNIKGLIVSGNSFTNMGAGAVISSHTSGASIIGNTVDGHGLNNRATAAAIWPYYSDQTLIQGNRVTGGKDISQECKDWFSYPRSVQEKAIKDEKEGKANDIKPAVGCNGDGQAFDIDAGSTNTLVENNFSANNARGFLLVCGDADYENPDGWWETNIRIDTATVRYNTSYNDNTYGVRYNCSGLARNVNIHNNTTVLNGNTWAQKTGENKERGLLSQAVFTNCSYGNCKFFDNPTEDNPGEPSTQAWGNQFYYANNIVATYGDAQAAIQVRKNAVNEPNGGFVAQNNYAMGNKIETPVSRESYLELICKKNGSIPDCNRGDYKTEEAYKNASWFPYLGFPDFFENSDTPFSNNLVGSAQTPEYSGGSGWMDEGTTAYKLSINTDLNASESESDSVRKNAGGQVNPTTTPAYRALVGTSLKPDYDWNSFNIIKASTTDGANANVKVKLLTYKTFLERPTDFFNTQVVFYTQTELAANSSLRNPNVGVANDVYVPPFYDGPGVMSYDSDDPYPTFAGIGNPGSTIQLKGKSGVVLCGEEPEVKVGEDGTWECKSTIRLKVCSYATDLVQLTGILVGKESDVDDEIIVDENEILFRVDRTNQEDPSC